MKKVISLIIIFIIVACTLSTLISCNRDNSSNDDVIKVKDLVNREVEVPKNVNKVLCIGASALRLYSYFLDMEKLCGVEDYEKQKKMPARPYLHAYFDDFSVLPSCGSGGPSATPDLEKILLCNPDVVLSLYNDVELINELQNKLNIPIVCFSYGGSDPFSDGLKDSITLMGKVLGKEDRASEINKLISDYKNDLNNRVKGIEDKDIPTVFNGCNSYQGKGTFSASILNYAPFRELGVKDILNNGNFKTNNPQVENEFILKENPDYFFADVYNKNIFIDEYNKTDSFVKDLKCVKNNNVYLTLPSNQYYSNIEVIIANTYYIGKVVYPDKFEDINPEEKYDEICKAFLEKDINYYSIMLQYTNNFGYAKLDLS